MFASVGPIKARQSVIAFSFSKTIAKTGPLIKQSQKRERDRDRDREALDTLHTMMNCDSKYFMEKVATSSFRTLTHQVICSHARKTRVHVFRLIDENYK